MKPEQPILAKSQNNLLYNSIVILAHILILSFVCIIVWSLKFPAFLDYPQHLARMYIEINYDKLQYLPKFYYTDFEIAPYIGMDIFFHLLSNHFDIYQSGKLLIIASFFLIISGVIFINYLTFGRISLITLFAYPFLFSATLSLGFLNFYFSIGLVLIGFGLWLSLSKNNFARIAIICLYCLILYLVHLFGFLIFLLIIFLYRIVQSKVYLNKKVLLLFFAELFTYSIIPVLITLGISSPQDTGIQGVTLFGNFQDRLAVYRSPSIFSLSVINLIFQTAFIIAFVLGFFKLRGFRKLIIVVIIISFLIPKYLYGIGFTHIRLPIFAILLAMAASSLSLPTRHLILSKIYIAILATLSFLSLTKNYDFAQKNSYKIEEYSHALGGLEKGSKLITVLAKNDYKQSFEKYILIHISSIAVIEREVFIPNLFTGIPPIKVQPDYADISVKIGEPISIAELNETILQPNSGTVYWDNWSKNYDYITVIDFENLGTNLPKNLELVRKGSFFSIYKIIK